MIIITKLIIFFCLISCILILCGIYCIKKKKKVLGLIFIIPGSYLLIFTFAFSILIGASPTEQEINNMNFEKCYHECSSEKFAYDLSISQIERCIGFCFYGGGRGELINTTKEQEELNYYRKQLGVLE